FVPPLLYPSAPSKYVRVTWPAQTSLEGVQGYAVSRRVGNGKPTRLTGFFPAGTTWFADFRPALNATDYGVRTVNGIWQESVDTWGTTTVPTDIVEPPRPPHGANLRVEPNPFNPSAVARFDVAHAGPVRLDLLDVRGRVVRTV